MTVVVDACVVVKWYVPEEFASEADILAGDNFDLHAPELIVPEFGNIIWKKYRKGELTLAEVSLVAEDGLDRELTYHRHESLLEMALKRAVETGQTVYDWTYLSLAMSLSAPFVTADQRFYNALRSIKFSESLVWIGDVGQLS